MRAIGLREGKTKAEEFELPEPAIESPKQVLVQALQTGICGSDGSMIANGLADPPPGRALDLSEAEPGWYELICLPLRLVGLASAPGRALLRRPGAS